MAILNPRKTKTTKTITFKVDVSLAEDLSALQERAKTVGLYLDLDASLSRALARLLKVANKEIESASNKNAGGSDGQ